MDQSIGQAAAIKVAALAFPGSVAMDTVCFLETLSAADWLLARGKPASKPRYEIEIVATEVGPVSTMLGIGLLATKAYGTVKHFDSLMIPGGSDDAIATVIGDARLMNWLREYGARTDRLIAIGTGTFVLAAAGLLAGRRVTTHWGSCADLRRLYPDVTVEQDNIFVQDGKIFTAAGVTAAIDLALHLIEIDFGRLAAFDVARAAVLFSRRAGGQPQVSSHLIAQSASPQLLKGTPEWIIDNLQGDLSVETLSERSGMSTRNFIRVFTREIGLTPGKFVERARVERARQLIHDSSLPMKTVADATGFGTEQNMRRSFIRVLGVNPLDYAERVRDRC